MSRFLSGAIAWFGLYVAYLGSFGARDGQGFQPILIAAGASIAFIGSRIGLASLARRQKSQDAKARRTLDAGDLAGKALYLRSFQEDGRFELVRDGGGLFGFDRYDRPGGDSLERLLAEAFRPTAALVGAGGRGDAQIGVGVAGTLPDWQTTVAQAIATATWIVVIPSARPGTQWEIGELLRRGALRRTLFVMPPSIPPLRFSGDRPLADLWAAARTKTAVAHGLTLPAYDERGALFRMDQETRDPVSLETFPTRSPRRLAAAINRVV